MGNANPCLAPNAKRDNYDSGRGVIRSKPQDSKVTHSSPTFSSDSPNINDLDQLSCLK
jgi:hypothetical protein